MEITVRPSLTRVQTTDYATVRTVSAALCSRHACLRSVCIGASVLERDIGGLVLTPPGTRVPLHRILICAAFHGQEWMTSWVTLRLCEDLCLALESRLPLCGLSLSEALRDRQIFFLPLVNPDGVEIALHGSSSVGSCSSAVAALGGDTPGLWQANARGVDINHNFNAGWKEMQEKAAEEGYNTPGPRRYSGPHPESEPETRAVTDLCRQYPFRHVIALHSQGEEIYWRYDPYTPPQSSIIARVLGTASGYTVTDPVGFAANGGMKDWFIRCFHRPGFTIELGKGVNPLPLREFEAVYRKAKEMLVLSTTL